MPFVLIGALVNFAVAWMCVIAWNPQWIRTLIPASRQLSTESRELWSHAFGPSLFIDDVADMHSPQAQAAPRSDVFGSQVFQVWEQATAKPGSTRLYLGDALRPMPPSMVVIRAGWPLRAFECRIITEPRGMPRNMTTATRGGFTLRQPAAGGPGSARIDLPYVPMLRGFTINTILYAALARGLSFAPGAIRRVLRDRHGRCTNCGYDLRGVSHHACPECGYATMAGARHALRDCDVDCAGR